MKKRETLSDLIPRAYLRAMTENFSETSGMTVALIEPGRGVPEGLLIPGNHRYDELLARLVREAVGSGKSGVCADSSERIYLAVTPVYINKRYLGCWFVREEDPGSGSERRIRSPASFFESVTRALTETLEANHTLFAENRRLEKERGRLETGFEILKKSTEIDGFLFYVADFFTGEILMSNRTLAVCLGLEENDIVGGKCWEKITAPGKSFCADCPRDMLLNTDGYPGGPVGWEKYLPKLGKRVKATAQAAHWADDRLVIAVSLLEVQERGHI